MGWIAVGVLFWVPSLWHLALVNGSMSIALILGYLSPNARTRTGLHIILIAMTLYGALTVWTTPSLEVPW
jgi:hypothetical protein